MGVGGQRHAPAALPLGKTPYPLYRRLDGPQGRSRRVRKISPPPGFDPRTVQPVASRYSDCASPSLHIVSNSSFTMSCPWWYQTFLRLGIFQSPFLLCVRHWRLYLVIFWQRPMRPLITNAQGCFPGCSALLPTTMTIFGSKFQLRERTLNSVVPYQNGCDSSTLALYSEDHEFESWPANRTL